MYSTIYRIQDDSGVGPYRSERAEDCNEILYAYNEPPRPYDDGIHILSPVSGHYYAFLSMDDLYAWFNPKQIKWLIEMKFYLLVLHVPDSVLKIGDHQVAYLRDAAEILERRELTCAT